MNGSKSQSSRDLRFRLLSWIIRAYQYLRVLKYKSLSSICQIESMARLKQPALIIGKGRVKLGRCVLGYWPSPFFLNGYIHIEARNSAALIEIGDGVRINNNAVIIAEGSSIHIGSNTLIGTEFTVYDTDGHDIHPDFRTKNTHQCKPVVIGNNVFIGSRVTILKGVRIGDNAVIGAGSIISKDVPAQVVVGNAPVRQLGTMSPSKTLDTGDLLK